MLRVSLVCVETITVVHIQEFWGVSNTVPESSCRSSVGQKKRHSEKALDWESAVEIHCLFSQIKFLLLHFRREKREEAKKYLCFKFIGLKHWLVQRKMNSFSLFCARAQREIT